MYRFILFIPIFVFSLLIFPYNSNANVLIEDVEAAASATPNQTQIGIETGVGQAGDYVLFSCATTLSDSPQSINDPTPGDWNEIDLGECGSGFCIHGIWGGFTDNPNSENITCSWTENTNVSGAGSFRYTGVDPDNPIIGVDCAVGFDDFPTAPSIQTEAGSQVVRIFTYGNFFDVGVADVPENEANADPIGSYFASATGNFEFINSSGLSVLFSEAGPTGTIQLSLQTSARWRACTIALRMRTTEVPTMNEWGMITFAAFAGIAGFWFIRRRQLTA